MMVYTHLRVAEISIILSEFRYSEAGRPREGSTMWKEHETSDYQVM